MADKLQIQTYGRDGTIHQTGHLNVEVNEHGQVVAVWFRCMLLPFKQTDVAGYRALEMETLNKQNPPSIDIVGIEYQPRKKELDVPEFHEFDPDFT